jgi:hypothetical protein
MDIHKDRKNGKLWLSQYKYVEKILMRFDMNDVRPIRIPLDFHFNISLGFCPSNDNEKDYMSRVSYANAVGSLMYEMVSTRQDISHEVGVVSIYMENTSKEHWETMKCVLWYLRGTSNYSMTYDGSNYSFCGYVDSDFAGNMGKRRSISGYVFNLAGGPIS